MTVEDYRDVLVVDDDAGIRQMVCAALQHQALFCDAAADGAMALEYLHARSYAVLLLDLMMPRVDGVGVLAGMAARLRTSATGPIVLVMTAFDNRLALPAIGEAVHALIHKPFDLIELVELVSGCVRIRREHVIRPMK
jgi:DNA-binding response OmpR family regulator